MLPPHLPVPLDQEKRFHLRNETMVAGRLQQRPVGEHTAALPSPDARLLSGVRKCIAHSHTYGSKAGS